MLWIAGLLGLMGIGGAALLDFGEDMPADDAQTTGDGPDPNAPETSTVIPADEFLDSTSSGTDQGLELCDFIDTNEGTTPDSPGTGDSGTGGQVIFDGDQLTGTETADILGGGDFGDEIAGREGNDQLNGYGGNDSIAGDAGDDSLHGDSGDDTLNGGSGDDLLHGEYGDDSLAGGAGHDSLYGHFGADTLMAGGGDDLAHAGQGNDSLNGEHGNDALHGNDGDDTLQGGAGQDSLFGGLGNDFVWGADDGSEQDYLNGGDGDDTLVAGGGDIVTAGAGADAIWAEDLAASGEAVQLMDFDSTEDQLVVFWNANTESEPEISVQPDDETPGQHIIRVNGTEVLRVTGAAGLSAEDIALMDASAGLPAQTSSS
ncbi:calcium-binding protein [Phaeobacter sp. 11ANDIMAR09]|uniref:calcium-binding protein n=1 Tax=Phaeobacter sp. 11ANDIMAR09 TaxID=1225647 RepID=UPI0006C84AC0|nr:calcium-binding protein [Phaeobacter sp. 11ANDIMAR09]KPD14235.1 type I secretion protein [Phaeobacter sp. 11ANDIMAR09]